MKSFNLKQERRKHKLCTKEVKKLGTDAEASLHQEV
jgi:hypothetical protein